MKLDSDDPPCARSTLHAQNDVVKHYNVAAARSSTSSSAHVRSLVIYEDPSSSPAYTRFSLAVLSTQNTDSHGRVVSEPLVTQ